MKPFIYCFAFFFSLVVKAQSPTDYRNKMTSVFANLNRSDITTGYLSEYAYPLIPLENFNGSLASNNVNNQEIWHLLYGTWYSAYIASSSIPGDSPATVNTTLRNALVTSAPTIPVALLFATYNNLRSDAVTSNLLSVSNDQFYDVSGRSQSPYNQQVLFAAASVKSFSESNEVSFLFSQSYLWGNGSSINVIELDFGEGGGYQSVSWGTPITHVYSSTGSKRVKVRLTPSVGSTVENHFDIQVETIDVCTNCRRASPSSLDDYGQVYTLSHAFSATGSHSGGTAFIYYSSQNSTSPKRIKKPLIIAEGYDINWVAPALAKDYRFNDFITAINELGGASPSSFNFNNTLDFASYDLVFVNYTRGTDAIERNAALVEDVINWVNNQKISGDDQNVVLGLSMGGLVARYALAHMVRNSVDTKTRLLITHDSPHRGANVPLGAQVVARLAAGQIFGIFGARDIIPRLDQLLNAYDEPATNQLLIYKANNGSGSVSYNSFLDNDYRNMVNLSSTPYRIISTSNGSQCGQSIVAPGGSLVNYSADGFLSPIPWITNHRVSTEFAINALPNQQAGTVFHYKIQSTFTFLSVISINIIWSQNTVNCPIMPAYDGAPGGYYALYEAKDGPPEPWSLPPLWFLELNYNPYLAQGFTFVPTASALDVTNFDVSSLTSTYVDGLSPSNPTRAGKFIAQEAYNPGSGALYNEKHIRFTARNSQWIFNEMENPSANTVHCTTECSISGLSVAGPNPLCTTGTYQLSPSLPDITYSWVSSNTGILSIDAASGLATKVSDGQATISSTVNGCAVSGVSKTVQVGTPVISLVTLDYNSAGTEPVSAGSSHLIEVFPQGPNSYTFTDYQGSGDMSIYFYSYQYTSTVYVGSASTNGDRTVRIEGSNSCGTGNYYDLILYIPSGYRMAANPAHDNLTVIFANTDRLEALPDKLELLSEGEMKVLKTVILKDVYQAKAFQDGNKIVFDISQLPTGRYYLRATKDKKVEMTRLIFN